MLPRLIEESIAHKDRGSGGCTLVLPLQAAPPPPPPPPPTTRLQGRLAALQPTPANVCDPRMFPYVTQSLSVTTSNTTSSMYWFYQTEARKGVNKTLLLLVLAVQAAVFSFIRIARFSLPSFLLFIRSLPFWSSVFSVSSDLSLVALASTVFKILCARGLVQLVFSLRVSFSPHQYYNV